MSKFDVLKEGPLLLLGEEGPQLDEVSRHFLVELGFEAGHFLERSRHRALVEDAPGGEKGRELLPLRVDRGLAGEEARVVGHGDLVDLLFLLGREIENIEGIVGGGLDRGAPRVDSVGDAGRNQDGEHNRGESRSESH